MRFIKRFTTRFAMKFAILPVARFILWLIPIKRGKKPVTQLPEETVSEYYERVPLVERPVAEPIKLDYRGRPLK